ncbi:MAG: pilus assembly protein PilM, partial [Planctomycetes bacterium]|nr:pilus assembly protein PilM [Planctomycetota bacterium]
MMPIGLDIGSTAVRAVQLVNRRGQLSVASAMEVITPNVSQEADPQLSPTIELADHPKEGASSQPRRAKPVSKGVEESVRRLIEMGEFMGRKVVLQCPAQQLDMRPVHLPAGSEGLPRSAILGALRLKVADHISFPVEQAVIDYHLLQDNSQSDPLNVIAITADSEPIKRKIEMLRRLQLQCVGVDAQPFTIMKLLQSEAAMKPSGHIKEVNDKELVAVLDIGFSGSTLVVIKGGTPLFSRRFSLGGRELTEILVQSLMVDRDQAESLNKVYGLSAYNAGFGLKDNE